MIQHLKSCKGQMSVLETSMKKKQDECLLVYLTVLAMHAQNCYTHTPLCIPYLSSIGLNAQHN